MDTYDGVCKFFGTDLIAQAEEFGYSPKNILILKKDLANLLKSSEGYVLYQKILSCYKQADNREPLDFARDLVAAWIFEDYVLGMLKNDNFSVRLNGADKEREILESKNTEYKSDYRIKYNEKKYKMELGTNYTGYWQKYKKFHLRCEKYQHLVQTKNFFLGISASEKTFFLIDFMNPPTFNYIVNHPRYNKPAYEISLEKDIQIYELSKENLVNQILELIHGRELHKSGAI